MRKSIFIFLFLLQSLLFAQQKTITYTVDLVRVNDDRVKISMVPEESEGDSVVFLMPKIIPGTYQVSDYGRFVSDFRALDDMGNELPVIQANTNTWVIKEPIKLSRITYYIDDTYDADMGEIVIDPMGGTNIEKDKNFVLNNAGYFGYIKGQEELPIELHVIRPKEFYGSSGLEFYKQGIEPRKDDRFKEYSARTRVDIFRTEDYHELIDSPMMYNFPDTTILSMDNMEVLVSVYSPSNSVSSTYVAEIIEPVLEAQIKYLGDIPTVNKYAFLFYFEDYSKLAEVQGALEHNYSSYYYFPDVDQESLEQTFRDFAAHEFFHIVTPLSIHSEEIEFFDFNNPRMSKHLWLYEGITEYFAGHVQLKYDLISLEEYLEMMRLKLIISNSDYDDNLPFTELSRLTLEEHADQYQNVYLKGALIGLCLDIKLLELSDGKFGLRDLISKLTIAYGKKQPFKDDELFGKIEEFTYPEIGQFIQSYIEGTQSLPYSEILNLIGISYLPYEQTEAFTLGNIGFALEGANLVVNDISNMNEFGLELGYRKGDVILGYQGNRIPDNPYQISTFIENTLETMVEGEEFTALVQRKNFEGETEEVELSAKIQKFKGYAIHVLKPIENLTEKQKKLKEGWLKK